MDHERTPFHRLGLGTHPVALPEAFVLAFDVATFAEDDFHRHGVARPTSIVRSVPKRQAEYLAGRRAALAALREAGSDATDLSIGPDRAPCWPAGFIGSISHATGIAAAIAVTTTAGVNGIGIDVERIGAAEHTEAIRSIALVAHEEAVLASLAAARGWPYALTLAFSAKESFYKATAATVGHFFDFSALRIDACDAHQATLDTRIVETLAPALPTGQRHVVRWVEPSPGVLLTSCAW
ncbi:MAG: Enterobactin synthase component D [Luteibacter sp.]|uniref:4'-phosphopantetheinyl transferase family protein n=1 Tax=Luteibacter sp. TaxID=1886636 RepID=UPI00137F4D02|nr:4'-phosphopantetheinyl transferase superfamily protein [Luteibacter sp.]KAF1007482.1 MAG: Enterobactin synthase component D [Luteibacter sp.]